MVGDPDNPLEAKWNGAAVKSGQSTTSICTSAKLVFNPVVRARNQHSQQQTEWNKLCSSIYTLEEKKKVFRM